jgi:hypothetical protein
MKPCSLPTCRAGLHQFSAAKSHIIFLYISYKKGEFEEFLCYSYTLFLKYGQTIVRVARTLGYPPSSCLPRHRTWRVRCSSGPSMWGSLPRG